MYVYDDILQCDSLLLFAVDAGDEQFLCTRCVPFLFRNDGSITPQPCGLRLLDLTDVFILLLLQHSDPYIAASQCNRIRGAAVVVFHFMQFFSFHYDNCFLG